MMLREQEVPWMVNEASARRLVIARFGSRTGSPLPTTTTSPYMVTTTILLTDIESNTCYENAQQLQK